MECLVFFLQGYVVCMIEHADGTAAASKLAYGAGWLFYEGWGTEEVRMSQTRWVAAKKGNPDGDPQELRDMLADLCSPLIIMNKKSLEVQLEHDPPACWRAVQTWCKMQVASNLLKGTLQNSEACWHLGRPLCIKHKLEVQLERGPPAWWHTAQIWCKTQVASRRLCLCRYRMGEVLTAHKLLSSMNAGEAVPGLKLSGHHAAAELLKGGVFVDLQLLHARDA